MYVCNVHFAYLCILFIKRMAPPLNGKHAIKFQLKIIPIRWKDEKQKKISNSKQITLLLNRNMFAQLLSENKQSVESEYTNLLGWQGRRGRDCAHLLSFHCRPPSPLFNPRRPSFVLRGCWRWRQTLLANFAFPCVALYHFRSHLRLHCFYTSGSTAYFLLISLSLYIFFSKPLRAFATKSPGMFPESRILAWR